MQIHTIRSGGAVVFAAILAVSVRAGVIGFQPYSWGALTLGGYGYVTGIVNHPTESNLVYIRTDVGGVFRWDEAKASWIPLFEEFPIKDGHLFGVDGIAVDPNNANTVYAACGDYREYHPEDTGDVLKSIDRGETWKKTGLGKNFRSNAVNDRYDGECIAVKPGDSKIVLVGTRWDGLFRSADGAATWNPVTGVPEGKTGVGIRCIIFDPMRTDIVYIGIADDGVYKSTTAGVSFAKMAGSPANQSRMAVDRNGVVWVTAGHTESTPSVSPQGVFVFSNNQWVNRRPSAESYKGFGGLAVNPKDPRNVIVAPHQWGVQGIYVTADGGVTWINKLRRTSSTDKNYTAVFQAPWWQEDRISVNPSQVIIDPLDVRKVWFGDGAGVWRTLDITAAQVQWNNVVRGHEELILTSVVCPPSGAPLLVTCFDGGGLRVTDPAQFPRTAFTRKWSHGTSVAFCETEPNYVVWLHRDHDGARGGAYSVDNGVTWAGFASWPFGDPGKIAVSATKPNNGTPTLVIIAAGRPVHRSTDNGRTWAPVSGISGTNIVPDYWRIDTPVEADKVDGNLFYIFDKANGTLYGSSDGGRTWTARNGRFAKINAYRDPVFVRTVPGRRGEVWINNGREGLFRSTNEGTDFVSIGGVEEVVSFDLGKPQKAGGDCALYLFGRISGQEGVFRSDDLGNTWIAITNSRQGFGNGSIIAADRQVYGRVYLNGPPGRYGIPNGEASVGPDREVLRSVPGPRPRIVPAGRALRIGPHTEHSRWYSIQGRVIRNKSPGCEKLPNLFIIQNRISDDSPTQVSPEY